MALLTLLADSDPRLHTAASSVCDLDQARELAVSMALHLELFSALGLSANQVGHDLRLFVMRSCWGTVLHCMEPVWLPRSAKRQLMLEGCVSYPAETLWVLRYPEIQATWVDPWSLEQHTVQLEGQWSQCFQHECDHLLGVTMWDRAQLSRSQRRHIARSTQQAKKT